MTNFLKIFKLLHIIFYDSGGQEFLQGSAAHDLSGPCVRIYATYNLTGAWCPERPHSYAWQLMLAVSLDFPLHDLSSSRRIDGHLAEATRHLMSYARNRNIVTSVHFNGQNKFNPDTRKRETNSIS